MHMSNSSLLRIAVQLGLSSLEKLPSLVLHEPIGFTKSALKSSRMNANRRTIDVEQLTSGILSKISMNGHHYFTNGEVMLGGGGSARKWRSESPIRWSVPSPVCLQHLLTLPLALSLFHQLFPISSGFAAFLDIAPPHTLFY